MSGLHHCRRALAGTIALALGAGPIGVFLMLRRMSLVGDAMAHAILPGAAIGFLFSGLNLLAMTAGGLIAGYLLLGATWLIMKTEGALQLRAVQWARGSLWFTALGVAAVSLATPWVSTRVFDKWFALQAGACDRDGDVLPKVRQLLMHPDFEIKNPNRARSLIFSYCNANPAGFHRADASGYVLWSEKVMEIDGFNPQVAARLARALDRWRKLAEPYRSAAREAIAQWHSRQGCSASPESLVLTASTSEAYGWLFKLLCEPGDAVLVPAPSYPLFDCLATLDAVRVLHYRLDEHFAWAIEAWSIRGCTAPSGTSARSSVNTAPFLRRSSTTCRLCTISWRT